MLLACAEASAAENEPAINRRRTDSPRSMTRMRLVSRALDSSLDHSEFLSVVGDDFVGNGQQGSQLRLHHQITLGLQDKPLEFGELGSDHVGESSTCRVWRAVQNCTL